MLYQLFSLPYTDTALFGSAIFAFFVTIAAIAATNRFLPQDGGRQFAVNGALSKGKPRGAGIIFILCLIALVILFVPFSTELLIYLILLTASMMSGYLDDRSSVSWGEYKKGIIDLIIALVAGFTFTNFNPQSIGFYLGSQFIEIPQLLYVLLAAVLIWVSINVTNCSDGVDGLCGSVSIVTFGGLYLIFTRQLGQASSPDAGFYAHVSLLMMACLLGYLWFNVSPSRLLMGDAGSRAIGFLIAVLVMKTCHPLLYLLLALVLIIDGGLGLIKVSLLRFCKIHILKNVRTPIHDHVRKKMGWSDTQVVFRFTALQLAALMLMLLGFYQYL